MVHRASEVSIREGDASERSAAQDVARCGLAVRAEEESRLRAQIGMPPAIENDRGDITPRIEACLGEHARELLADAPLVFSERRPQHLCAPLHALLPSRQPG